MRGHAVLIELADGLRRHAHLSQRMQRPGSTIKSGIRAGNRCGQDDERKERAKSCEPVLIDCSSKDAFFKRGLVPRQNRDQQRNRDDIKRDDAPRHIAYGNRDTLGWFLALPSRQTNDLRSLEIHQDDDHGQDNRPVAIRRKTTTPEEHAGTDIALIADESEADQTCHGTEGHERYNLDQC